MLTTLGYEEMKRLHDERVARSLRRYEAALSAATPGGIPPVAAAQGQVIDLPPVRQPEHRIGA